MSNNQIEMNTQIDQNDINSNVVGIGLIFQLVCKSLRIYWNQTKRQE